MIRMIPQRAPGPPFWVPGGGLDLPFGSLWVPCGPTVVPGSILGGFRDTFRGSFGAPNLRNLLFIFDVFSGCFLERCWSGSGAVLGDFLVPKR